MLWPAQDISFREDNYITKTARFPSCTRHVYWSSSSFLLNIIKICRSVSKLWSHKGAFTGRRTDRRHADGYIPRTYQSGDKKGEPDKASNYRPVSLTSLSCKIQEHIKTSKVLNNLDEHEILTDCQHGFRARDSCETQLLTLAHELI